MSGRRIKVKRGRGPTPVFLELLVEEESASVALDPLLRKLAAEQSGKDVRPRTHPFRGKPDLLCKLPARLRGYASARARGDDYRVIVLLDQDDDDCTALKKRLDALARDSGLAPRPDRTAEGVFHVLNRIAVRELESWYFGDWNAVRAGFPKISGEPPRAYRKNPDLTGGKSSDVFRKELRSYGVRMASKPEWGRRIGPHLAADSSRSPSFRAFVSGVRSILAN